MATAVLPKTIDVVFFSRKVAGKDGKGVTGDQLKTFCYEGLRIIELACPKDENGPFWCIAGRLDVNLKTVQDAVSGSLQLAVLAAGLAWRKFVGATDEDDCDIHMVGSAGEGDTVRLVWDYCTQGKNLC